MEQRRKRTFQNQVMRTFLPATILIILVSGIMMYVLGISQVRENARYLIANTTRQTAALIDGKLSLVLERCNDLGKTMALWRLINHPYTEEGKNSEYKDMITVHESLQDIYKDSGGVVDSIAFQTVHGNRLNVYYDMVYDYSALGKDTFAEGRTDRLFWIGSHQDQVFATRIPREVFSLVIPYASSRGEYRGTLVVNFKADYFKQLLADTEISPKGYIFLLGEDGALIPPIPDSRYSLEENEIRRLSAWIKQENQAAGQEGRERQQGSRNLQDMWDLELGGGADISYTPLTVNGWAAVSVAPHSDLYSTLDNFKTVLAMILLASAFLSVVVSAFCSRYVSRPIKRLSEQVVAYEENQQAVFEVEAGYEIMTLAGGLNHLRTTIDQLLSQVREEQKQKSNLELMIMQSQIKPHFLYNTLGSIKAMTDLRECDKASAMCDALIQFYRISLSNGRSVISVEKELELVGNYLRILEFRYGERFEYSFEVEEEVKRASIPRMTLQPLVENAVYHGIKPRDGSGMILISGQIEGDRMVLTVYDDGVGMDGEQLQSLREDIRQKEIAPGRQGGFAMRNVYMRLKGFYGEETEMKIDSVKDVYTQIRILVPADEAEGL